MGRQSNPSTGRPNGRRAVLAACLVLSTSLYGCNPKSAIDAAQGAVQEATNALGNAAATLNNSSVSWQDTLKQLESGLSADAKKLIDNDIQGVISRTIDQGGVEFRCDTGFVNQQVAQDLLDI